MCTVCMIREFTGPWGGGVEHAKVHLSSISIMKNVWISSPLFLTPERVECILSPVSLTTCHILHTLCVVFLKFPVSAGYQVCNILQSSMLPTVQYKIAGFSTWL